MADLMYNNNDISRAEFSRKKKFVKNEYLKQQKCTGDFGETFTIICHVHILKQMEMEKMSTG